jgi:hypothetical protein
MIPFTIVDKPGSVNTILAADRAASVAPETATPTSARLMQVHHNAVTSHTNFIA